MGQDDLNKVQVRSGNTGAVKTASEQPIKKGLSMSDSTLKTVLISCLIGVVLVAVFVVVFINTDGFGVNAPTVTVNNIYLDINGDGRTEFVKKVEFIPNPGNGKPIETSNV